VPSDELFRDRARAESFGTIAEQYDRIRPPYPDALIIDLLARGPLTALDVGCGTGKAARQLAERGLRVLGVEVDAGMADIARRHGIDVEVASFESWDDAGRRFDLITSGQAWHWVEPTAAAQKAVRLLSPGGTLALFWNMHRLDTPQRTAIAEVYRREAPDLAKAARHDGGRHARSDSYAASLGGAGFDDLVVRDYPWERVYTRDEWLALLRTYSNHNLLPDDRLQHLLDAVGEAIDDLGGDLTAHYETHAVLARSTG
jgi:SAM-dependent methyltransferase